MYIHSSERLKKTSDEPFGPPSISVYTYMYPHTQAHSQIKNKKHSVVENMSTQKSVHDIYTSFNHDKN